MLFKNLRLAVLVVVASVCGTSGASARRDPCPKGVDSRCCALSSIIHTLQADPNFFNGGQCNKRARQSLRLAFHDAIGFSKTSSVGGGADGSVILFKDTELKNGANTALDGLVQALEDLLSQYRSKNTGVDVTAGDIIQLAAAVGIGNCPGAPQLPFLLGRRNATMAAENDLIPTPFDSADTILSRFADAGFSPFEVVALLASHSIATSSFVKPGARFDCSPHVFDTRFYAEVQGSAQCPIPDRLKIRLTSDTELSQDNRTASIWRSFINDQAGMVNAFRDAMAKLAVVGQDTSNMIDCSGMIPTPQPLPQ